LKAAQAEPFASDLKNGSACVQLGLVTPCASTADVLRIRLVKVFVTALFLLLAVTGAASANCLSQAEARAVVASGQAQPLGAVAGQAGGEIIKAQLCRQGGGYVYVLSVLKNGQVTNVTVNANR
jgi:ABC-type multidrug transport system permease subunit